jgi:hypothetical protein
LEERQFFLSV